MRSALLLAAFACLQGSSIAQDNVLILLADDIGVDYVGCYGEGPAAANTPNIDALAERGVLFRNVWAAPICSATRAQIMTGRLSLRHGIGHVANSAHALSLGEITIPEILDNNAHLDVAHAAFGKWHLGNFQVGGELAPNMAGWSHFAGTMTNLNKPEDYYDWEHVENGFTTQADDYATTRAVDDFLDWHAGIDQPWLALVGFHAAHEPLHAPPSHLHSVTLPLTDPRKDPVPFFQATVEALDTEIGRLLAGLGDDLDKTNVIFVSDNGTIKLASVPPFEPSHAKMTPYEGGIGVPMVVAGPAVVNGGREVRSLVNTTDLFATSLELAGVALNAGLDGVVTRDGISFVPYLESAGPHLPLRTIDYQEYFFPSGPGPYTIDFRIARDARFKLIRDQVTGTQELYDLRVDPFETNNLLPGPLPPYIKQSYKALSAHIDGVLASE